MKIVKFSLEQGNKYFGEIDDDKFFIGKRVSFDGNKGLMNTVGQPEQKYKRDDFRLEFGFWADFIHPTAMCEGALYHTLNTYDRARFTFSFLQFAAHVPNGDFVIYFRELLKLPNAEDYFPDLTLHNNRISLIKNTSILALESDDSTSGLMEYLNPSSISIEDTEVIQAARFIHWVQNDPQHRQIQIEVGISLFKEKIQEYDRRYKLDGISDDVCVVIADIRHQGRAKSAEIITALRSSKPLKNLLKIGEDEYSGRLTVLKREIEVLKDEGRLGIHKYSTVKKDFV